MSLLSKKKKFLYNIYTRIKYCIPENYLSASNFIAVSTREWIVVPWRLSPTVPEKILKLSSSEVLSVTFSSSLSIPNSLKIRIFVLLALIIHMANSITNLLILGTLMGGHGYFFKMWTSVLANSSSWIPTLTNIVVDSSEVINLKTRAASPTITSCNLPSCVKIALSTCERKMYSYYKYSYACSLDAFTFRQTFNDSYSIT